MSGGRRLRAPTTDGVWLIDPPWSELPKAVAANIAAGSARFYDFGGTSLAQLSEQARVDLIRDALRDTTQYRDVSSSALRAPSSALVLAGHQPEMFHPGVWAKNFALAKLAQAVGGTAINLVIDGDTAKTVSLRVPTGSVEEPRVESVPFDAPGDEIPHEERRVADTDLFASFGERAATTLRPLLPDPLMHGYWPRVRARHAAGVATLGDCLAEARHQLEGEWGLETLEYRQSRMCETPSFRRFALHLLARLPEFHAAHNGALVDYRRRENIRSANHPVPALAVADDYLEAPLWVWTTQNPRRRRVFARRIGGGLELTDRGEFRTRLPLAESDDVAKGIDALQTLAEQGIKLRSRALLTTMYARLVLGDLFIHGIGGGKYDELTDEIVRRFFEFEPPGYAVVTATRRLPIPLPPRSDKSAAELEHELWELAHHPERFLTGSETEAGAWIEQKRRWTETAPTRENGRERCHAIRDANAELRKFTKLEASRVAERLVVARRRERTEALLTSREFSSFLFPEQDLREFLLALPTNLR
jgi:hypothetical protein